LGGTSRNRLRGNRLSGNGYSAQQNNFGIGLENAGTNDNIVEDNTVIGNTNGLYMTAGVQGNIIRRNLLEGNPPVQVAVDHSANIGFDIKNLADPGANIFVGNICATSLNAPCPSVGPSLNADPNPIPVTGSAIQGSTTISWNAPGADVIEIHISSPDGKLFTRMGFRGSVQTGAWVADGTTFYLQDVTGGRPLTSDYTLATLVVHLQPGKTANFHLRGGPHRWVFDAAATILGLVLCGIFLLRSGSRAKGVRVALSGAVLLVPVAFKGFSQTTPRQPSQTAHASASSQISAQQTPAKLDQMIAAGASPRELAQYIFNTHGCKTCHTIDRNGKLGFTTKGSERAKGFEGCVSTLKAMSIIGKIPEDQRSATQRQRAQRFEEFGCATCHKVTPAKMDLTAVGAKLSQLHLGCVEVERLLATTSPSQR
jgi:parallel beta-helix repeat protein